jgi:lipopolysaccharide export system protein LptA
MVKVRDFRSIIIILVYVAINAFIINLSLFQTKTPVQEKLKKKALAPDFTEIENLDYFHLKEGLPLLSLSADRMKSQGQSFAEFDLPKGVYNYQKKNQTLRYQAVFGVYRKKNEVLTLEGKVKMETDEAEYFADQFKYFIRKDLIIGQGSVKVIGDDLQSKDHFNIESDTMRAHPNMQWSRFRGNVRGSLQRKKKFEGASTFSSLEAEMDGVKSLAQLRGDVKMKRDNYLITAGKGDIHLENYNKSLKYFVFNDDVKVTETVKTPEGITTRNAFAERLEGFGREEKMVLSGAPRVEMGKDVVKGYRITIRENVDLIEVDDALSDVEVKKKKKKEEKN